MAVSTAVSVAAFSVVLTESFAAVAASTLIPATFLAVARAAKNSASGDGADALDGFVGRLPGASGALSALKSGVANLQDIDLLVPKTAKIKAEFTFEATERYSADAAVGAVVNVIAVAAAYSALYETSTTNKITLEVDFAAVNYTI